MDSQLWGYWSKMLIENKLFYWNDYDIVIDLLIFQYQLIKI